MSVRSLLKDSKWALVLMAAVLVLIYQWGPGLPKAVEYSLLGLFLILSGIPHGALDHEVMKERMGRQNKAFSWIRFLGLYLGLMLGYGLLWYFFPMLGLFSFLLFSAWHFGEGDWQPFPSHFLWKAFVFLSGAWLLLLLLTRDTELTGSILMSMTQGAPRLMAIWNFIAASPDLILLIHGALCLAFLALAQSQQIKKMDWQKSMLYILFLAALYFLPLLPAFALYFGGWHAISTFHEISRFLTIKKRSLGSLWLQSMPFTILSFLFLLLGLWVWKTFFHHWDPLPALFIFISLITLPHLLVIHGMLAQREDA